MNLNTNRARPRRTVIALTSAALALGGGLAFGGDIAAADAGDLAARSHEPVDADPGDLTSGSDGPVGSVNPWIVAIGTCSTIYPSGTDITSCVENLGGRW